LRQQDHPITEDTASANTSGFTSYMSFRPAKVLRQLVRRGDGREGHNDTEDTPRPVVTFLTGAGAEAAVRLKLKAIAFHFLFKVGRVESSPPSDVSSHYSTVGYWNSDDLGSNGSGRIQRKSRVE
jgi:hypothetical protein